MANKQKKKQKQKKQKQKKQKQKKQKKQKQKQKQKKNQKQKQKQKQKNQSRHHKGHPKEESNRHPAIALGPGPVATLDGPEATEVPLVTLADAAPTVKHEVTPPMRTAEVSPPVVVRSEELPTPVATADVTPGISEPVERIQAPSATGRPAPLVPDDPPRMPDPVLAPSGTGASSVATGQAHPPEEIHEARIARLPISPPTHQTSQQPMNSTTPSDVAAAIASSAAGTLHEKSTPALGATAEEVGGAESLDPISAFIGLGIIIVAVVVIIVVAAII